MILSDQDIFSQFPTCAAGIVRKSKPVALAKFFGFDVAPVRMHATGQ
jgi:hypothetical protein